MQMAYEMYLGSLVGRVLRIYFARVMCTQNKHAMVYVIGYRAHPVEKVIRVCVDGNNGPGCVKRFI